MLRHRGFTLTEMAVVLFIISLLIGGAMLTLQARTDQHNHDETQRRLNTAADAIIGFAIVNRRLPCPARFVSTASNSGGAESFCTGATGTCAGTETLTVQTHGNCSNFYSGFVPGAAIGASPVDNQGFLLDAWNNRIRYAVARDNTGCTTTPPANTRVFTSTTNMRTYGVGCRPNDLDVCATAACAARVVSQQTAVLVIFSTGKNGAAASLYGTDENENTDNDATFVSHTPDTAFDDLMVVVPVGVVYGKLISAGALP